MATDKRAAKPVFYAVVFRGKPKVVRAFLHGLTMGAGTDATLFFNYTDGIAHEGKLEQLAEKVGLLAADCHVVVDARTSALIKSLAKRISSETGLEIGSHRRIRSARLAFSYTAYTPQHDRDLLAAVEQMPAGVRLQGFEHVVKSDPSARGVEAYAPTHHFEATGGGVLHGPVDALVELRRRMAQYPLIAPADIELVLG